MSITVTPATVTIASDEQMLADVQQAIRDVLKVGQGYAIMGSRTFTAASLPELQKLETLYRRRVLLAKGETGRNLLDMSQRRTGGVGDERPTI